MSGQEISVAVAEPQCVIFVILNDSVLGMVKHGQLLGGGEQIGYALPRTDFAAMSRAMGGRGYPVRSIADFYDLNMHDICSYPGPCVLDVYINAEEIPPMGSRLHVLAAAQ